MWLEFFDQLILCHLFAKFSQNDAQVLAYDDDGSVTVSTTSQLDSLRNFSDDLDNPKNENFDKNQIKKIEEQASVQH